MLLEGSFLHIHSTQRALAGVHRLGKPRNSGKSGEGTELEGHLAHLISLFSSSHTCILHVSGLREAGA